MITSEKIIALIQQHIQGTDIFLVEADVKQGNLIRVYVDRPDGISIDECVKISRFINEQLDRDVEDYSLEVSSPGASSPYRVKQQYEKNIGRMIEVTLEDGDKITGKLATVSEDLIVLTIKGREKEIVYEEIKKAKSIISFN